MRIGVDTRLMYHQPAGISRYTWHLLHAMANLDTTDEFIIFQHRKHRAPLIEQANFRRATLFAPVHSRLEQYILPAELLRFPLDLIHSTDFIPPLHSNVPAVVTVHDLAFLHWPHFLTATSAAYYGQIDRAVHHARHIIVPSESTKHDLVGQMGAPDAKVSVIYEAADPRFRPLPVDETRRAVTAKFGIPDSYVFFVSTIEPRKNVNGLLEAFRILIDRYNVQETGLVLAGSKGWLYEETMELVNRLNLADRTFFLGRVSDEDLHQLYVGARCHIHPALYEGFGLPPLEAMACGTPVVSSNAASLPEVVGNAAILVDPHDVEQIVNAMRLVLTQPALAAALRAKGLARAAQFSWERTARETIAVYERVLAGR